MYSGSMNKPNRLSGSPAVASIKRGWFSQLVYPAVLGSVILLAGCATPRESHRVSSPPPDAPTQSATQASSGGGESAEYVTTTTAVPGTNMIIVNQQPPAPPVEAVVAQPSKSHVWTPGFWTWRNDRYEWMAGRWEIPPHANAEWINPRWEQDGNAYRFYEGYWK